MTYPNSHYLVETNWLESNLTDPSLRVLDCSVDITPNDAGGLDFTPARKAWQSGHIPGADFIDFNQELSDAKTEAFMLPDAASFSEVMSHHGVGDDTRVILYDGFHNMWAARLWWMLRAYGFTNVAVLNGGLNKWKQEGRPLSSKTDAYPPARFVARPDDRVFVSKDDVLAAIDDQKTCVVDALNVEYYSGASPVGVARPGHIRSAANVPWLTVVDLDTHTYLLPKELRRTLQELGISADDRVITYCGAGIAASGVAFAMALMGRDNVSVYDGSVFEWAADPTLPMETSS